MKFKDIDIMTEKELVNERERLKSKIGYLDLTEDNNIRYFYRVCDINHKLKLIEKGNYDNVGLNLFKKNSITL